MKIKDLVTAEQYIQLQKEYKLIVKNKEISFFEYCTNTYKLKKPKTDEKYTLRNQK